MLHLCSCFVRIESVIVFRLRGGARQDLIMYHGSLFSMYVSFALGVLGGLLSGVFVYLTRQKIRGDRLRRAIVTEIRKSTPVGAVKTAYMGVEALETPIIDSNLDKIHLLSKEEIRLVSNYHRHMARVRSYNKRESDTDRVNISHKLTEEGSDLATRTTECLESNIWSRPHPIRSLRALLD